MIKILTTLTLNSGATAGYKQGEAPPQGLREALMVCMSRETAVQHPMGIVRADLDGAIWAACHAAGAIPAIESTLTSAAEALISGVKPLVVVDINAGSIENARMVFDPVHQQQLLANPASRSMEAPPLLPHQMGSAGDGGRAVLFRPEGEREVRVRSIHPNQEEAALAEQQLKDEMNVQTAIVKLQTPITAVVKSVLDGKLYGRPANESTVEAPPHAGVTHTRTRSLIGAPTPFA